MPEPTFHQASGLMGMAPSAGPRLLAMVSHGDDHKELPLLWQLCTTLVAMGYAVTVLDGTQVESPGNPGLSYLMRYNVAHESMTGDQPDWNIVPAAQGVHDLCTSPDDPKTTLIQIGRMFPANAILILYCGADHIAGLLEGSSVKPLMVVSSTKGSLLTSYWALKRILVKGHLEPTIVDMANAGSTAYHLSECARNFLGYDIPVQRMPSEALTDHSGGTTRKLALRLLESSLSLGCGAAESLIIAPSVIASTHARSH